MATVIDNKVTNGVDGVGKHLTGGEPGANGNPLNTDIVRNENVSPNLLHDVYDEQVVKMGFTNGYINAITRETGFKATKSMRYGYFSIDLRVGKDSVKTQFTITTEAQGRGIAGQPNHLVSVAVNNPNVFDITDQIQFRGIPGYYKNESGVGEAKEHMCLNGIVRAINYTDSTLSVQFINGTYGNETQTIPADTEIYILGHAAGELDAATVPYSAVPTDKEQYMQKFMVQSLVGNVMMESEKNASWDKDDIDELLLQQFITDVEKAYIFGAKGYLMDQTTKMWTYTTSGIIEQIIENGGNVIEINKSEFDDAKLIETMSTVFVGNSGSNTRYLFTGNGFATKLFTLPGIVKYQNVNDVERRFEYDFKRIRLMSYTLLNASHPMLDYMGMTDAALVIDKQYLQRRVFRSLEETELCLKEAGVLDATSTVWCEISSVILKYPKCHALILLVDDEESKD